MFLLNGNPISLDVPFQTEDGTQYPANWIRLASPEERAAIGITEVADPEPYDDRFYWGVGIPKDLEQCKQVLVAQIKQTAGTMLAPTDWKITRAFETQVPVDQDLLKARANIRRASNDNEQAVNNCTTVEELAALQFYWPV